MRLIKRPKDRKKMGAQQPGALNKESVLKNQSLRYYIPGGREYGLHNNYTPGGS